MRLRDLFFGYSLLTFQNGIRFEPRWMRVLAMICSIISMGHIVSCAEPMRQEFILNASGSQTALELLGIFVHESEISALIRNGSQTLQVKNGYDISPKLRVISVNSDHVLIGLPENNGIKILLLPGAEKDHITRALQLLQRGRMLFRVKNVPLLLRDHCKQLRLAVIKLEMLSRYGQVTALTFRVLRWELRQQEWLLGKYPDGKTSQSVILERLGARLPLAYELVKADDLDAEIGAQVRGAIQLELSLVGDLTSERYSQNELSKALEIVRKAKILAEWLEERAVNDPRFR